MLLFVIRSVFLSLQLLLHLQKKKCFVLGTEKTSNLFYIAHSVLGRLEAAGAWSRNKLSSSAAQIVASLLPCPACAHGFIFPSLLVACSLSNTPLWTPDVLLTASFTLAMSVVVQIIRFWNPIRLYPSLLFSGVSFSCGWGALRMGHWQEGLGLNTVTQSLRWVIKPFLWKIAAVVLLVIHSAQ